MTGAVRCELMSLGNREVINLRLSRWNYGFRYNVRYDPNNEDHKLHLVYDCPIEHDVKKVPQIIWLVRKV